MDSKCDHILKFFPAEWFKYWRELSFGLPVPVAWHIRFMFHS